MKTLSSKRGSAILGVLIAVIITGALMGSYLQLALSETRASQRNLLLQSSLNLAEAGAEEAFRALNSNDFTNWTTAGASGRFVLKLQDTFNGSETHIISILVDRSNPSDPHLISEGRILSAGMDVSKQVRISLGRRGLFANGLTAKDTIRFAGGNATVDSFNSNNGPYDPSDPSDRGTVGSISVETDAVTLSNAKVFGYVATGGADPKIGPHGEVLGKDSPAGLKVDWNRVAKDFYAEFELIDHPSGSGYDTEPSGTMGTAGADTEIRLGKWRINNDITVSGHVTLIMDDDFTMGPKGTITIAPNSSLRIFAKKDISLNGTSILNASGLASSLFIIGTAPTSQNIDLNGQGVMYASVYAPNADVKFNGGGGGTGHVYGAVIAKNITITGNYAFHYDEALDDFSLNERVRMTSWRELLSAAERFDFSPYL